MKERNIDPERDPAAKPFDAPTGYSGQDYTREREAAEGRRTADPAYVQDADGRDIPPDNGQRASLDRVTGEVHGAGVGAGGGQPGEDFDSDPASGDGYPLTGSEGIDKTPGDLGPAPTER